MNDEPQLQQPMHQPIFERRSPMPCAEHEKRISLTEQAVISIKQTSEGMTTKLDLILAQVTKVAILEERHNNQQSDVNRAHDKISNLEDEVNSLAKETRAFISYSQGRDKVLWALGAVVLGLFVKALFFASSHGMTP